VRNKISFKRQEGLPMRKACHRRPRLESLESISLLSGLAPELHAAAQVVRIDTGSNTGETSVFVSLNGTLTGTYTKHEINPDVGANYTFFGHGTVSQVGKADVTGSAQQLGFVATGRAEGLLVISTPQGSLTLKLEGPRQKGFAPLPDRFSFEITNASGNDLHDRGHGKVVVVLDPAAPGADHGTFTMVFVS
jgi:hypothetical protein